MRLDAVDLLLAAMEAGVGPEIFADTVTLDATVPNWRFTIRGKGPVRGQLAEWFRYPGRFDELRRHPLPGGELIEFTLSWHEHDVPYACHQAHVLQIVDGAIATDTMFCGGRWEASLLARMADANLPRS
jgi:hypothetical protein